MVTSDRLEHSQAIPGAILSSIFSVSRHVRRNLTYLLKAGRKWQQGGKYRHNWSYRAIRRHTEQFEANFGHTRPFRATRVRRDDTSHETSSWSDSAIPASHWPRAILSNNYQSSLSELVTMDLYRSQVTLAILFRATKHQT